MKVNIKRKYSILYFENKGKTYYTIPDNKIDGYILFPGDNGEILYGSFINKNTVEIHGVKEKNHPRTNSKTNSKKQKIQ